MGLAAPGPGNVRLVSAVSTTVCTPYSERVRPQRLTIPRYTEQTDVCTDADVRA